MTQGSHNIESLLRQFEMQPRLTGLLSNRLAPVGSGVGSGLLMDQQ
jgi:hypothetical protein